MRTLAFRRDISRKVSTVRRAALTPGKGYMGLRFDLQLEFKHLSCAPLLHCGRRIVGATTSSLDAPEKKFLGDVAYPTTTAEK